MITRSVTGGKSNKRYFYYLCDSTRQHGKDACPQRSLRADEAEARVWEFVSGLLQDSERLHAGLDAMVEEERAGLRGDLGGEVKIWLDKLADADRMRAGYQELAAKGLMTLDELGERLAQLEEERSIARNELEALKNRRERLEAVERDRDVLLQHYAELVPEALDTLSPEERHRMYRMLRLKVTTKPADGGLEVTGILCGSSRTLEAETGFCHSDVTRSCYSTAGPQAKRLPRGAAAQPEIGHSRS